MTDTSERERTVLVCAGCDRELECCALCDEEEGCPSPSCYSCLVVELGESRRLLHRHGG